MLGSVRADSTNLSGTELAILNRESGDSESCDSKVAAKVALNIDRLRFGLVIPNRFFAILLCCVSAYFCASHHRKFWRFHIRDCGIVGFAIRDSVLLRH